MTGWGLFVISTSSSLAYAVSILPFGKMLDLQGGSSSSQKSRSAAIFGSPVIIARRVEKSCAVRIGKRTLLPCSERLLRSIQDPSTNARDDKDDFCFQRSFGASLRRMTGGERNRMTGGENGPLRLLLCHPERSGGSTIAPAQSNGSHARSAGGDDRAAGSTRLTASTFSNRITFSSRIWRRGRRSGRIRRQSSVSSAFCAPPPAPTA